MRDKTAMSQPTIRVSVALAIAMLAGLGIASPAATQSTPAGLSTATAEEVERFCTNVVDAARDRRYAMQQAELQQLQKEIDSRIKLLEQRRAEYEDWLKRREAFVDQAKEGVLAIYSKMRPDAAAMQMAELRADIAAALLMKLEPQKASVILNEMDKKVAANLTHIMVAAARPKDPS